MASLWISRPRQSPIPVKASLRSAPYSAPDRRSESGRARRGRDTYRYGRGGRRPLRHGRRDCPSSVGVRRTSTSMQRHIGFRVPRKTLEASSRAQGRAESVHYCGQPAPKADAAVLPGECLKFHARPVWSTPIHAYREPSLSLPGQASRSAIGRENPRHRGHSDANEQLSRSGQPPRSPVLTTLLIMYFLPRVMRP